MIWDRIKRLFSTSNLDHEVSVRLTRILDAPPSSLASLPTGLRRGDIESLIENWEHEIAIGALADVLKAVHESTGVHEIDLELQLAECCQILGIAVPQGEILAPGGPETEQLTLKHFQSLARSGVSQKDIATSLRNHPAGRIHRLRLLREIFGLSLSEAENLVQLVDEGELQ